MSRRVSQTVLLCEDEAHERIVKAFMKECGLEEFGQEEPAVLLIPKRHIETWIDVLLGKVVTEDENCKTHDRRSKEEIRKAAQALFAWSRPNATPDRNCVDSLKAALSEWRKI